MLLYDGVTRNKTFSSSSVFDDYVDGTRNNPNQKYCGINRA